MPKNYDVIIIGAGPAGATAALYTARIGYATLLLDSGSAHGHTGPQESLLDFPGAADQPTGDALLTRLRGQARDAGAEVRDLAVTGVAFSETDHIVTTNTVNDPLTQPSPEGERGNHTSEFHARCVILASGCGRPAATLPGEMELYGRGVSYHVMRDMYRYRGQPVALYGKTIEAAQAVLLASRVASQVTFIVPSNKLELPEALQTQLQKSEKIHAHFSASLKEIRGNPSVTDVVVLSGGQEKIIPSQAIFLYHHPHHVDAAYLGTAVERGTTGNILVDEQLATSAPGVFACGDVLCGEPQIPVIAAAQGAMAALSVEKFLTRKE